MEKMNCYVYNKNGVSKLPPGFRFQPTEEEIVFQYLKCKVFSCKLPASIIPDINVCNYNPWDLPGNCDKEERYFFSCKEAKYRNGNRMNRTTTSGYWKATGSDKTISSQITTTNNFGIAGIRKTLVFYKGKSPNGSRTNWVMHEYRLLSVLTFNSSSQKYVEELGDWVLCRIFMKKRSVNQSDGNHTAHHHMVKNNNYTLMMNVDEVASEPRFFDFMRVYESDPGPIHTSSSSSSSYSSNSSYITESLDHEETSGYIC